MASDRTTDTKEENKEEVSQGGTSTQEAERGSSGGKSPGEVEKAAQLRAYRFKKWIRSPRPYLMMIGVALFLGFWFLTVEVLRLPRFAQMPGLTEVVGEWLNPEPVYGVSIFTPEYYQHIWASVRRVLIAFTIAIGVGIPLGLFMGWSTRFKELTFPVFEMLRPIPILAWVPLAILMFSSSEGPIIFLTFLASFFATTLNTMLGVHSIDRDLFRAAHCLGSKPFQVFRHIVVPGSLPFIFTGLQIAMGIAWFSLVAGEMIAGKYGLGYLINDAYQTTRYPTIIIGMITLGAVGYGSSAIVRMVGNQLMAYRQRTLGEG